MATDDSCLDDLCLLHFGVPISLIRKESHRWITKSMSDLLRDTMLGDKETPAVKREKCLYQT